jgi:hypothetical protein
MKLEKILLLLAASLNLAFCASSQSKMARENEKSHNTSMKRQLWP